MTTLEYLKNERQTWLELGYNKDVTYDDDIRKTYLEELIANIEDGIRNCTIIP